ncbi:MAG: hypothetical protein IJ217_05635 [Clostridia bacterium]|nr:hypothetical protein [Clostridia bacterium]
MDTLRKKQVIALASTIAFGILHFIWGREILAFIARYLIYWVITIVWIVAFVLAIICAVKNEDPSHYFGDCPAREKAVPAPDSVGAKNSECPYEVDGPND